MKKIRFLLIIILLSLFAFCTGTTSNTSEEINSITGEELTEMLTYLSSDELEGRLAGEKGCELAADYITKQFEEYGLTPGMGDSYNQNFEFIEAMEKGENAYFDITKDGKSIDFEYGTDYHIVTNSSNVEFEGEMVFAGYSVTNESYDDYADIDVKNKVVIVFRYTIDGPNSGSDDAYFVSKISRAIENGAKGLIIINGPAQLSTDPPIYSMGMGRLEHELAILQLRWPGAEKLFSLVNVDLKALQEEIDENRQPKSFVLNGLKLKLKTELIPIVEETYNVVGYFPGNDPVLKDEVIVVGAHYDHLGYGEVGSRIYGEIHNGADDNGSGTVAIMEIAEAFSMIKDKINRTIVFIAFSAEEYGLYGSQYYVNNPIFPLEDTVLMVNFDMVGYLGDSLDINNTSDIANDILEELSANYPFDFNIMNNVGGGSDHVPFASVWIPVVVPFTGLHDKYHTPDDDIEYINFEGLTQISKLMFELIYKIDEYSDSLK